MSLWFRTNKLASLCIIAHAEFFSFVLLSLGCLGAKRDIGELFRLDAKAEGEVVSIGCAAVSPGSIGVAGVAWHLRNAR